MDIYIKEFNLPDKYPARAHKRIPTVFKSHFPALHTANS